MATNAWLTGSMSQLIGPEIFFVRPKNDLRDAGREKRAIESSTYQAHFSPLSSMGIFNEGNQSKF